MLARIFCTYQFFVGTGFRPAPSREIGGARRDKTSRFRKVVVPIEPGSGRN